MFTPVESVPVTVKLAIDGAIVVLELSLAVVGMTKMIGVEPF